VTVIVKYSVDGPRWTWVKKCQRIQDSAHSHGSVCGSRCRLMLR